MFVTNNSNLNQLSYGFSILFIAFGGIQQYLTPYFSTLGKSYIGFNILLITYFFIFLSNFFASYFINKFGTKNMIFTTGTIYLLAMVAITSGNEYITYLGALLLGLGGAVLWNSQNGYLLKLSTDENRGGNSGFFLMYWNGGMILGILLLGILIEYFDYSISFYLLIILGLFSLIFFYKMDQLEESYVSKKVFKFSLKTLTLFRLNLMVSLIFYLKLGLVFSLLPLQIHTLTHSNVLVGAISSLLFLIPILLSKYIGSHTDEYGRNYVTYTGILIGVIGLVFLHFSNGVMMLSLGALLLAVSLAFLGPIFIAYQGDISTEDTQAYVTNIFMLFKYLGLIVGISLGYIFGVEWGYLVAIIIIVASTALAYHLIMDVSALKIKITEEIKSI